LNYGVAEAQAPELAAVNNRYSLGGAGAYARKTVAATAGNTYTVCAAGSTACMPTCCGTEGSPSFVSGGTGGSTVAVCAAGGPPSFSQCFMVSGGCACVCQNTLTCRSE